MLLSPRTSVARHHSACEPDSIGESTAYERRPWRGPLRVRQGSARHERTLQTRTAGAGPDGLCRSNSFRPRRHRHSTTGAPSLRHMPLIGCGILAATQHPPRPLVSSARWVHMSAVTVTFRWPGSLLGSFGLHQLGASSSSTDDASDTGAFNTESSGHAAADLTGTCKAPDEFNLSLCDLGPKAASLGTFIVGFPSSTSSRGAPRGQFKLAVREGQIGKNLAI
jgi:hypothetical protein